MIQHVVTKKLENVERMKGIVIMTVIAKRVSSVALIIVQVISHRAMTAVIKHQVQLIRDSFLRLFSHHFNEKMQIKKGHNLAQLGSTWGFPQATALEPVEHLS